MTATAAAKCRTCGAPIWHEVGRLDGRPVEGWSDRIGSRDSIVCFRALNYRHVPQED